ncbi:MAG: hypothetical protein JSV05_06510 [Candidatus Bathyarchaeota archaeon]|nr:MAG: hypothetical protein JSV05_06510 [Candidatus Bathyarchaeota archaeon]
MASIRGELSLSSLYLPRSGKSDRAFKYRDRLTIFVDILNCTQTSKNGRTKTQILQSANLNYHQVTKYLSLLLDSGYIARTGDGYYRATVEGLRFARTLESLGVRLR